MSHVVDRPVSHVIDSSSASIATPHHHHLDLQRFSLDIDQAFETVECRPRRDMDHSANQWFYDEFSGMYRHKAPPGHPAILQSSSSASSSPLQQSQQKFRIIRTPSVHHQNHQQHYIHHHRQSTATPSSPPSNNNQSGPLSWQRILANGPPYPPPESVEQIYSWRDESRRRPQWMLCLACHLMDVRLPPLEQNQPEQPASKQQQQLRQVAAHEAYRLLKRLTQYRGSLCGEAHYLLANCHGFGYFNGSRNPDQAYIMYTQASKQNHGEATYRTAVCLELGLGTHQDLQRAFVFYRKAAHLGHPASMYKLGMILFQGQLGQSVHKREAISWLQRAAETSAIPLAQHTLAMIQLKGGENINTSNDISKNHNTIKKNKTTDRLSNNNTTTSNNDTGLIIEDYPYAIELLYDAAQEGFALSQFKLAECFEHGLFVHPDMDLALYWYTKAAESGNAEAALALSGFHLTGFGALEQSDRQAYLWARKAVTMAAVIYHQYGADRWTLAKAYFMVGYYTEQGIGLLGDNGKDDDDDDDDQKMDEEKNGGDDDKNEDALVWYKRASDLGHAAAFKRMASSASSNVAAGGAVAVATGAINNKSDIVAKPLNFVNDNRCIIM
ncbi:hypothetical protein BDB00DRAFT_811288 [Zychaea mexicana]|uniref:uncharacterized protein n=1 Tax=Zychaea mexicana TaxID=64656 RepID=UPI0022FF3058|nr:uncharacterized protein BDB00DRAFT_811288 [Zychaea mexicana]KAI9495985.1 hypothetical protein BDB00DRAFT_811288 [Zychaea mexicana]